MQVKKKDSCINITVKGDVLDTLLEISKSTNRSVLEVLSDAVALEKWVLSVRKSGKRLLIESDGEVREVVVH